MSIGVSISTKPCASIERAQRAVDLGPQAQVALHALAAQVDVAVAQAHDLVGCCDALVERERRRLGRRSAPRPRSRRARPRRWRGWVDRALGRGRAPCRSPARRTRCAGRWAPSTTHWTMPVWSRTSMNARCSPCSRRRATQPHSVTVASDVGRAQRAAVVGAQSHDDSLFADVVDEVARSTGSGSPFSVERAQLDAAASSIDDGRAVRPSAGPPSSAPSTTGRRRRGRR